MVLFPVIQPCSGILPLAFLFLLHLPVSGQVILTEFMAAPGSGPDSGLRDSDGSFSDWVEVHNAGPAPVNLENWTLTDKADNPSKWSFPPVVMAPGAYLIVFASEKNRTDPDGELHTNFKLGSGGEYLGLRRPDGAVATEFSPAYPPQLPEVSYGLAPSQTGYTTLHRFFLQPSPGALNGTGSADPGPIFSEAAHSPLRPLSGEDITVTVRVQAALAPVEVVWLHWIAMYESSTNVIRQLPMSDGGEGGDAVAGDGIYTAVIPGTSGPEGETIPSFGAGRLIRWFFTAADAGARESRWPLFADPDNSAEFLGTVSRDPANFTTTMPVWYWFARNAPAAGTDTGTRGSVFYRDRYYDNVFIRRRGGATSTNSRKFDFNSGDHCYIDETVGRVEEANLNLSSQDSTLARPPMAFEAFRTSGHPACAAFPVIMRLAGSSTLPGSSSATNTVSYFVEQVDERFLERHGLDPDGALYKMNQKSNLDPVFTDAIDGVEKRTRLFENNVDLAAVCTALRKRSTATLRDQRAAFLFDHFDLANMVNYLAVRAVINDYDDVRKNFYFYRDTRGDGEWMILPWDKDGTLGVTGDGGTWLPHPFFGDLAHLKQNANQWSLLWEAIFNEPRTREMYLRRLRSVMDHQLLPSGVPAAERLLDQRADAWGNAFSPPRSVSAIKSFLNLRRTQLYSTYAATAANPSNRLIPPAQEDRPPVHFGKVDSYPVTGRQQEEFVQLVNRGEAAVDLSGWSITGEIDYVFPPGTVLTANGEMFVAHDAPSFRARAIAPTGGTKLFVQGGWHGTLSARGGWLFLNDPAGQQIAALLTPSQPTAAQIGLRVSKIHYAPPEDGLTPAGDAEYLELFNAGAIPLELSGIHFDKGITFTFAEGTRMEAGTRLLLVKNEAVFSSRYGSDLPVAGTFSGSLDNAGERLRLLDSSGEAILDFSYRPDWLPATLKGGAVLVAADVQGSWTQWDTADGWRASTSTGGSPGRLDPAPPRLPALTLNLPGLLQLVGEPGSDWIVERSPFLDSADASWSPLATVVLGAGGGQIIPILRHFRGGHGIGCGGRELARKWPQTA